MVNILTFSKVLQVCTVFQYLKICLTREDIEDEIVLLEDFSYLRSSLPYNLEKMMELAEKMNLSVLIRENILINFNADWKLLLVFWHELEKNSVMIYRGLTTRKIVDNRKK